MTSIRRQVSEILGVLIPEGQWDETLREVDKVGNLPQKKMIDIMIVVLKRLEELENEK